MDDPHDDDAPAEYASPACLMHELAEAFRLEGEAAGDVRPDAAEAAPARDRPEKVGEGEIPGEAARGSRSSEPPAKHVRATRGASAETSTGRAEVSRTHKGRA